ncbi:MAG: TerB family tellurite resistance protein, partial [Flavobacteriales bacterium]|nr:TerB family tellurite resistance protein [Flavobacteriales bacterium]
MRGGKIFGGILGWAFLGPIGAIFGVAAGHLVDRIAGSQDLRKRIQSSAEADENGSRWSRRETRKERAEREKITRPGDFDASLLILSAAMMKADGKVLKSELNFVKDYLDQRYGEDIAADYLLTL